MFRPHYWPIVYLLLAAGIFWTAIGRCEDRPRWAAPAVRDAISVRDGKSGQAISLDAMLDALAVADAVFLGETHTDETTHRVELAVYEGLLQRKQDRVVLALEMFERDVQQALDDYLAGRIDEPQLLAQSRPWGNYSSAYRPLIERAKTAGRPVIASNFPGSLRMRFAMQDAAAIEDLSPDEAKLIPRQFHPNTEAYWRRVDNAVRGHRAMMGAGDKDSRLYSTQSLWDNSMGESCADAIEKYSEHMVLHINGGFHSAYWDGTVHQLQVRRPGVSIKTVSIVPSMNPASVELEGEPVADFVVLAEARATDLNDGTWSVYAQQEVQYRLHLPAGASEQHKVPLLIWLNDDGLTSTDGLDLWKDRLGSEAAIVVIESPYRETQLDLGVGGRWFWPDTFSSDLGNMVVAGERIWGYVMRHYPVDPTRVCVAGEGAGGTVAAAIALLSDRMDLRAVTVDPSHYAKLKDFPLPLPEQYGEVAPPTKSLQVIGNRDDQRWWSSELEQYTGIGIPSEMELRTEDPWQQEAQQENAIRTALGLDQLEEKAVEPRRFILAEDDLPRRRHWSRLHALWAAADAGAPVAVVSESPGDSAIEIPTTIRPEAFSTAGTLPECPGPFGGTTVVVLSPSSSEDIFQRWLAIEENDPLAKESRFHRLRVARPAASGRDLASVLAKLSSENRKNILIVPDAFCADADSLRSLKRTVRPFENEMTLHWLPGLGGCRIKLDAEASTATDLPLKHAIVVTLSPETHAIRVRDRIELPQSMRQAGQEFTLYSGLTIAASNPAVERIEPRDEDQPARYRLVTDPEAGILEISYEGVIRHELSEQKEEYTRGFRQTNGLIGAEGVYLDGGSDWVPRFDDRLIRFTLEVPLPENWHVISQGSGTSRNEQGLARWESGGLVEQVYLVGGPVHRYRDAAGAVETLVYLHERDEALASKYLDATARYIEMYRNLIGPYPYGKFALVENFWETGYGMPSFTLLGPQVLRFPFILHSSYPHEILHNWWGNSVFVDYQSGNWCEGLTAYLADHLVQEQRGLGGDYRRNALQKYRNYVQEGRDFPLVEFRERHNAATEAVGYGKALMMNHMLRLQIGDDAFRKGLTSFYRQYRGKRASFADLQEQFAAVAQRDLGDFFRQWTQRTGAPSLAVDDVAVTKTAEGFSVSGVLVQTQAEAPYSLDVPVTVNTAAGATTELVTVNQQRQTFAIVTRSEPDSLHVDPEFDLFRLLDPRETPSSIGQIFGEPKVLAILPSTATEQKTKPYQELMQAWTSDSHMIEMSLDTDIDELPVDRAVWVLGRENRFAARLIGDSGGDAAEATADSIRLDAENVAYADHCIVLVRRHPRNLEKAIGLLIAEPDAAFSGLARKLPHYGKYSYLAFEGDEPTNTVKGQWSITGSPLVVDLRGDGNGPLLPLATSQRKALAELPPVFSSRALMEHVDWLSAPQREGRGLGSQGLEQSADYIARQMADIGLQPGGDDGGWFQTFTVLQGPEGKPVQTRNVIGILWGKRTDWKQQSIVLSAHYDHLGYGWPDVRAGAEGKLHPGADDNASGVAVMLELARNLVAEEGGSRTLVCIAFSAEECGRLGSQHYVTRPSLPAEEIRGVINLDTVGRLFDGKVAIHATQTADEWQHIFRGCGFVTGIPNQIVPGGGEASDQMSFIEKGIPAVQVFTGAHGDYHRPGDSPDKVDAAGLVKVSTFVKEALVYLLEREAPLSVRIDGAAVQNPMSAKTQSAQEGDQRRRVLMGTVPVFDYQGDGVKIDSLVPDSPAAIAGLRTGDVIVRIDDQAIADLRGYSEALEKLQPGQTVTVQLLRDGNKTQVEVTVVER